MKLRFVLIGVSLLFVCLSGCKSVIKKEPYTTIKTEWEIKDSGIDSILHEKIIYNGNTIESEYVYTYPEGKQKLFIEIQYERGLQVKYKNYLSDSLNSTIERLYYYDKNRSLTRIIETSSFHNSQIITDIQNEYDGDLLLCQKYIYRAYTENGEKKVFDGDDAVYRVIEYRYEGDVLKYMIDTKFKGGVTESFFYKGMIVKETWTNGKNERIKNWDYDSLGLLLKYVASPHETFLFHYDNKKRLIKKEIEEGTKHKAIRRWEEYYYDSNDSLETIIMQTYEGKEITRFHYEVIK